MRREPERLQDILDAIAAIERYTSLPQGKAASQDLKLPLESCFSLDFTANLIVE